MAVLNGNSSLGFIERLGHVHKVSFPCWNRAIDLIGNAAKVSIEKLRYERRANSRRMGGTVALIGGVSVR